MKCERSHRTFLFTRNFISSGTNMNHEHSNSDALLKFLKFEYSSSEVFYWAWIRWNLNEGTISRKKKKHGQKRWTKHKTRNTRLVQLMIVRPVVHTKLSIERWVYYVRINCTFKLYVFRVAMESENAIRVQFYIEECSNWLFYRKLKSNASITSECRSFPFHCRFKEFVMLFVSIRFHLFIDSCKQHFWNIFFLLFKPLMAVALVIAIEVWTGCAQRACASIGCS